MFGRSRWLVCVVALFGAAFAAAGAASSGRNTCAPAAAGDAPAGAIGPSIHVLYARPAGGRDRSASVASQLRRAVGSVDQWWRRQDPGRAPRFDLARTACGVRLDLSAVVLPAPAEGLVVDAGMVRDAVEAAGFAGGEKRYLVAWDGQPPDPGVCGEGGGGPTGAPAYAVVYLRACEGVGLGLVVAHELLHLLGAMPLVGPPHACPGDRSHPCDSVRDVLSPTAVATSLAQVRLDVGRDDYYGHSGDWFDIRDSAWLRRLDSAGQLHLRVVGRGRIAGNLEGLSCASRCSLSVDVAGTAVLRARPARGATFVGWSGSCQGRDECVVRLDRTSSVRAAFE